MHYDNYNLHCVISIHALLAESDSASGTLSDTSDVISIHALLAESDLFEYIQAGTGILFLSTLSLRRATVSSAGTTGKSKFLSTLSLRRATSWPRVTILLSLYFYPRSPCGERRGIRRYLATR